MKQNETKRNQSDEDVAMLDSSSGTDDDDDESKDEPEPMEEDEEEEVLPSRRRRSQRKPSEDRNRKNPKKRSNGYHEDDSDQNSSENSESGGRRRSGRSNKYKASMRVPGESLRDIYRKENDNDDDKAKTKRKPVASKKTPKKNPRKDAASSLTKKAATKPRSKASKASKNSIGKAVSPSKSRGRHNTNRRHSAAKSALEFDGDEDSQDDDDEDAYRDDEAINYDEEDDDEEEAEEVDDEDPDETLKIQRILAVRSETRKKWREICASMQSSEVTDGSRWFQQDGDGESSSDDLLEERFLVKWNRLSYAHVSWETHGDLMDQVENPTVYMSTFFRKQRGGLLFGQDERKDGDYFDPGLTQIDRILEVVPPRGYPASKLPKTWQDELAILDKVSEFGMFLDHKKDPDKFEKGTGRQFMVKWSSLNYSENSYEFERDLLLMDQKESMEEKLKDYYERTKRPTRQEIEGSRSEADGARRRSYLFLGDNARGTEEEKESQVKEYQQSLQKYVFRNGGSLRDYQAEGVTWFLANFVNKRSCILADEMGLGKTLQTAAFVNLLVEKMHKKGPFLICVPLSTLAHWQREFIGWTGLNTIVYHGSAEDRKYIRETEFAFPADRPEEVRGINSLYLKKCEPVKRPKHARWMATVVVTTPEMLVADDWTELACVQWQVLVVDEVSAFDAVSMGCLSAVCGGALAVFCGLFELNVFCVLCSAFWFGLFPQRFFFLYRCCAVSFSILDSQTRSNPRKT